MGEITIPRRVSELSSSGTQALKDLDAPGNRMSGAPISGKGKIAALVGLSLLEVIRARDLPTEILDQENPSETMPRRLGLTEAVGLQIRRFGEEVRRGGRITDDEAKALFALVLRRPDAADVFFQAGEVMAGKDSAKRGIARWYPARVRYALARRQFRKRVKWLFGRPLGGFAHGHFTLEANAHLLLEMDSRGSACALLTGLAQTILARYFPDPGTICHPSCLAKNGDLCRWTLAENTA